MKKILVTSAIFLPVSFSIMVLINLFFFKEPNWSKIILSSISSALGGLIGIVLVLIFLKREEDNKKSL